MLSQTRQTDTHKQTHTCCTVKIINSLVLCEVLSTLEKHRPITWLGKLKIKYIKQLLCNPKMESNF